MIFAIRDKLSRIEGISARRGALVLLAGALFALPGCDLSHFDQAPGGALLFSPLQTKTVTTRVVEDPGAPAKNGVDEIQAIVADFELGLAPNQAGAAGTPPPNMADLESRFIQRGRYLDLVGIYQNMLDKKTGAPEDAASLSFSVERRLVRAYLRLGQTHLARQALDQMIAEHPDEPMAWFLNATFWIGDAPTNPDAAARVVANWQKALDIDPDFVGIEQPDVPPLKTQLDILRQRTPSDKIAEAVAELHQKMNTNAVAKTGDTPPPTDAPDTVPGTPKTASSADNTVPGTPKTASQAADALEPSPNPGTSKTAPDAVAASPRPTPTGTPADRPKTASQAPNTVPGTPKTPANADNKPLDIPYLVAYGNMALAQDKPKEAEQYFKQVLAQKPDHFEAQFGLIRTRWADESRRNALAEEARQLAARTDLTPRQQAEIGKFVYFDLKDNALALKLWKEVKRRDPKLAKSTGLDVLIEDASKPASE